MNKKIRRVLFVLISLIFVTIAVTFIACDVAGGTDGNHTHSFSDEKITKDATYNADGVKTLTCSCGEQKTESIPSLIPTKEVVAAGIATTKEENEQGYDFDITLTGTVSIMGFSGSADGVYSGKYRYNKDTGTLKFMRSTSGKLLFDSKEYVYNQSNNSIVIKTDMDNAIKKITVQNGEDELTLLNRPFVAVVQALEKDNLGMVEKQTGQYKFSSAMSFSSDFLPVKLLLNKVASIGSSISFKNVTFSNPQGGVKLYFNLTDEGVLTDFTYTFDIGVSVGGQSVSIALNYAQKKSNADFSVPNLEGYITDSSKLTSEINAINEAINAVKNDATYSIDLEATNEFDAGWNKLAIVDKYISRMYKNTNDERIDFNHSFKYKSHTETDGKESFTYTVGNVREDNKVFEISRKGSNTNRELEGVSADTRYDLLMNFAQLELSKINFLKKTANNDGSTTYTVFFKNAASTDLQSRIVALLNSNEAEGVIPIENYFDSEAFEVEGDYTITLKDAKIVSCYVDIEMHYTPTDGEYSDRIVTLNNTIKIDVNKNYDDAEEYVAPNSVSTKIGSFGLNNAKYYIL